MYLRAWDSMRAPMSIDKVDERAQDEIQFLEVGQEGH